MKKSAITMLIVGVFLVGQNKPSSQPADEETQQMCIETVLNYQKDLKDGLDNVKLILKAVQAGNNPDVNGLMAGLANLVPVVPKKPDTQGTPKSKQIRVLNQEL